MNGKRKTAIWLLVLTISTSALLTACRWSAGTDFASAASPAASPASSEAGEVPAAGEAGETVTVVYQTWNPDTTRFPAVKAKFEEMHPGIDISFINTPYTDHVQKLKIDLSSGQGPDIFGLQAGAALTEFSAFLADITPKAEAEWGSRWPGLLNRFANNLLNQNGVYHGLPLGVSYAGLLWVDRAWLTRYNLEVPNSLADLRAAAVVLRANGDFPLAIGAKDDWINLDTWMNIAGDINPEKLYAAIEGFVPFTDADLVESFRIWQLLFTEGIVQDGALGVNMYSDTCDLFNKEGSIPMLLNGSWEMDAYLSEEESVQNVWNGTEHDMVATRVDWNGDGKPAPLASSVDSVLCLNKNSKVPDEAWKLLAFLLQGGQDILINQYLAYFPSRSGAVFEGELSNAGKANYNLIVDWGQNNVAGYRENPYPALKQSIADNLKALALGDVTPGDAAATIEAVSQTTKR